MCCAQKLVNSTAFSSYDSFFLLCREICRCLLDDSVEVESSRLAFIEDSRMNQVLCYEWIVRTDRGTQYRIFVDAEKGKILKKEKVNG